MSNMDEAQNPLISGRAAFAKQSEDDDFDHRPPENVHAPASFSPISPSFTSYQPFFGRDRERQLAHDPSYAINKDPEPEPKPGPASRFAKAKAELSTIMRRKWPAIFASVVGVQAIICLSFEGFVYWRFQSRLRARVQNNIEQQTALIPLFLPLFIFGFIYENLIAWDALRAKNTIQIIGVCAANVALNVYTAIQVDQVKEALEVADDRDQLRPGHDAESVFDETKSFLAVVPCIIALCSVVMVFAAWKLYQEFAWSVLKFIGADYAMKRRLFYYQVYIAMLKFDFFFVGGFMIQLVTVVTKTDDPEFGLTIAAMPIAVGILVLAAFSARKENLWGMLGTMALFIGALSYFIFKLVQMNSEKWRDYYRPVRKPLTAFAVMSILMIICTLINAVICIINFDKGLKSYFENRRADSKQGDDNKQGGDDAENRRLQLNIE